MQSHFHGGLCCGIKHITGFWGQPTAKLSIYNKKEESDKRNHDKHGDNVKSEWDFCWEALPGDVTQKDRFLAYVDFIKRVRPAGAIECVLTDEQKNLYGWGKVFDEAGFKRTLEFYNSNSGNKLHIYYLVYGTQNPDCLLECLDDDDDDDYYDDDIYT